MTKEEAIALAKTRWWEHATPEQIVDFQLNEDKLCMDWGPYHEAVEKVLGRGVWTHEFAFPDLLRAELKGDRTPPTMSEILELIPADKRVVVVGLLDNGRDS